MSRVALVTGGSSGIGWSIAEHLSRNGYTTIAAARRVAKMAPLEEQGIRAVRLDVSDPVSVDECMAEVHDTVGEIDILINNAGIELLGPIEQVSMPDGRALFEVNFFGTVRLTQLCLPHMREQRWGRVLNVSSVGGVTSQPFNGWYHASKHAIEGFTKSLRQEMARFGVAASVIRPGAIQSEVFDDSFTVAESDRWNEDYQESFSHMIGFLRRTMANSTSPEPVAEAVLRAIRANNPRLSYAAPTSAKFALMVQRFLLSESRSNSAVGALVGGHTPRKPLNGRADG